MSCLKLEDLVCFYLRRKNDVQIPAIGREFEGGGLRKAEHIPQAAHLTLARAIGKLPASWHPQGHRDPHPSPPLTSPTLSSVRSPMTKS